MKRFISILLLLAAGTWAGAAEPTHEEALRLRRTPVVEAVERTHASVVNISTERVVAIRQGLGPSFGSGDDLFDQMFQQFFQGPVVERRKVQTPLGSGCVITPDGLVMTNEHVIRRATSIKLSLDTGESFDAVLLAADSANDLALLRAQAGKPLEAIRMGSSADLMLGETVIALGNPFGFNNSVTSGVLSAFNREIQVPSGGEMRTFGGLIQTSALINPGNSGGPLVNVLGELIGINSAVVDQAQGIGFAIPIDHARDALAPLLANPQVSEAWCGFRGATVAGRRGVRVTQLDPQGPADGHLKADDVIEQADGVVVTDYFDFLIRVVQHKPEERMALRVLRAGKPVEVTVTLARVSMPSPTELLRDKMGVTVQDLTRAMARRRGIPLDSGLLIAEAVAGGPAEQAGLAEGDVIVKIESTPVRNLADAAAALRATMAGDSVSVLVFRQNYLAYAKVLMAK